MLSAGSVCLSDMRRNTLCARGKPYLQANGTRREIVREGWGRSGVPQNRHFGAIFSEPKIKKEENRRWDIYFMA